MKIAISNLKGGVGKTTIAQNLAVCFAHMGFKTCIVDTDTNQNSLAWCGVRSDDLPSITVVGVTDSNALGKTVDNLHRDYDVVVIDGTPSLGEMTTRIILTADLLIIPILASAHDYRAMTPFFERYNQAKSFRENIPAYFLVNLFYPTGNVYKAMRQQFADFGVEMLDTVVYKRAAYVETAIDGKGVFESNDPKAKEEIARLTREILEKAQSQNLISVN